MAAAQHGAASSRSQQPLDRPAKFDLYDTTKAAANGTNNNYPPPAGALRMVASTPGIAGGPDVPRYVAAASSVASSGGVGGVKPSGGNALQGRGRPPPLAIANMQNLVIWPVTHYKATNKVMLCYRTLTRDVGQPNHNDDYLAERLLDELVPGRRKVSKAFLRVNKFFIESRLWGCPGIINYIDMRTRYFDSAVKDAIDAGIKQVVIVAAGFDTRAYRLGVPGIRFFEVDLPGSSGRKQDLVAKLLPATQYTRPTFVAADLSRLTLAEALHGTGFNDAEPTLFTVEGLIYYLPRPAVDALFCCIGKMAAPGSRVVFDFLDEDVFERRKFAPGYDTLRLTVGNKGEPKLSALNADPTAMRQYLGQYGFLVRSMPTPQELTAAMLPHTKWSDWQPPLPLFYRQCMASRAGP